ATYMPIYQSLGQYWGEQPGTSGPVYVGAFVLFLFVLGLFIVKGSMKWALLIATLLSITLAWGKNFMPWTDFFLDYVPMYDKFRTVASILVIAEFTIPMLAMLALKEVIETLPRGKADSTPAWGVREGVAALALTAGPCLLFWLLPDVFFGNYVSSSELQMLQNATDQGYIPKEMLTPILANLNEMRRAVFTADAGRSLLIILVGCAVLLAYSFRKIKAWMAVACLIVLCTADMWDVNKRYLNDSMFSAPQPPAQFFQKTPTDEAILQDPDKYYRVVNLAVSTFNDNSTSYWHKSIGGYHAAKLRRYQELIEAYIQPELLELHQAVAETGGRLDSIRGDSIFPVLNMLNTKYAILPLQGGETAPVQNPWAMGNAWMAEQVVMADDADAELMNLEMLKEHPRTAIFGKQQDIKATLKTGTGEIRLTAYEANALSYEAETTGGVALFSDIYYPGWQCTIDGQPAEVLRANYVLRAVVLPAGKHTIEFRFDPQSLHTTEAIANTSLVALIVLLLALVGWEIYRRRQSKEE
ncbi:MAG: YfhO family protein, partial [Bacteroidaceae bacterium]|nr:YfhO family protein [Bacteroidaceae bacterium]